MDKLGIESDIEIDRCHIIGPCKTRADQNRDQPCTVVCRLDRFKDKQCILYNAKKLKKMGIFIYEDFLIWNLESHYGNKFWNIRNNKFACLHYRSIIVRDHNGVRQTLICFIF